MKNFNLIKILLITSIFTISLQPLSVKAIEYGGFGGRPTYPRADNPRTESIFVHTLNLGATQEEGVTVINNSPETKTMLVYAADSTPSSGGAFACKQFAEANNDVGSWITLAKSEVTVDPGKNEIVPFTIHVPENASVGEHNGCILVQEKKEKLEGQTGAVLSVRTGLRVAITVPGEIIRKLEIVGFTIESSKDGFVLKPLVKNTGNVSIDADAKVVTRYFFGLTHFTHGGQYPILRGDTSQWNFELKKPFWGGWFRSNFTVTYDQNSEASVGVESGKTLTKLMGPSAWFFSFPKPLALAIEIAVLLLIILGWWLVFHFGFHKKEKRKEIRAHLKTKAMKARLKIKAMKDKLKKIHRKH